MSNFKFVPVIVILILIVILIVIGDRTQSPVVVDGNDNEIGLLVNINDDSQNIDVLTEQNYVLDDLSLGSGEPVGLSPLFFASADCTGTAYTDIPAGFVRMASDLVQGFVLHYVDKNSIAISNFSIGSSNDSFSGCSALGGTIPFAWPALLNDPTITGVSSQAFQLPIKIERR